ncbi:glycosyltransferase family 4 protein [Microvirga guangxiensis]|uniref:Glycosyltransferase involved in cell wall bisynthesis n=1 Tax=Microvirga guangxiensis TaxID=549386 RepID=A0A1G5I7L9_9HYPH|nr:glycosyltransferase family 4 protein [Microvirga guangxiensis]SCY71710.1 Glycosyltransferase involved in cell wall bisynthesis [Microvirga guangxiensis]
MKNEKSRILIVDLSKRHGGVDTRVIDIAVSLRDRCEVKVVVLQDSQVAKLLQRSGVETYSIKRRRHDPRIVLDIMQAARAFQPDVIDAHNPQSQLWGALAAKLSRVRTAVATVHSIYGVAHRGFLRQHAHEGVLHLCRMLGLRFIVVSKSIQVYLMSLGISPSRITLSYNGVPTQPYHSCERSIRRSLNIPDAQFLVGMVGRIQKVKGYDILVSAISRLRERGCYVQVVIAGEGTEEDELRRLIRESDLGSHIHFIGFRKDVASVMAEIDVLCMPSRSEGLPYTALEAASAGLPLVATRVGGIPEVFIDRETALLVAPNDVEAIADALEELSKDGMLRLRLGQSARDFIRSRLTVEQMVSETLAAYSVGR